MVVTLLPGTGYSVFYDYKRGRVVEPRVKYDILIIRDNREVRIGVSWWRGLWYVFTGAARF